MQGATTDKILHPVLGKPVFQYSLEAFVEPGFFSELVIVYRDDAQRTALEAAASTTSSGPARLTWCQGGQERMDSVRHGLAAFQTPPGLVFIHDCARPMVKPVQLRELAEEARTHGAACLARPVADTLKRTDGGNPAQLAPVSRDDLWAMETPQVFQFDEIREAYDQAAEHNAALTDDTSALALLGKRVRLVANPRPNPKITTPEDLDRLALLLQVER